MFNDSEPKDIKRSVRDRYKRRLQWLTHAVEQFEYSANERIKHGGNIKDRDEIEAILKVLDELKPLLPEDSGPDEETNRKLSEFFNIKYVPLDKHA